jgi:hypothetical protein
VIQPQAGHNETKHLSKNKPFCHITPDDDDDDDDDNHLNNLPDTLCLKCRLGLTSWWVHSVTVSVYNYAC